MLSGMKLLNIKLSAKCQETQLGLCYNGCRCKIIIKFDGVIMNIIAQRGSTMFLVTEIEDPKPNDFKAKGFIIDIDEKTKSDELGIQQVLKWGYWTEATPTDEVKKRVEAIYK